MKRVFVGMSGGVDSSVAAYLLKKQGYDVVGVFMRCYNIDGCAEKDAEDARRVAGKLQIPFYVWDFEEEYKKRVVEYMVEGYRAGLTPNPDVMCNREIKFGLFLEKALKMGADYVATGHYARVRANFQFPISNFQLLEAKDKNKDQSYFLWTLTQKQLKNCLFPIGDYSKPEVRAIARRAKLPTAEKKDSQGICFLGDVTIANFLGKYIPAKRGVVLAATGEKIGEHRGAHFYTIGQRGGIFIGGVRKQGKGLDAKPLYVTAKDVRTNTLIVAERDDITLTKREVILTDVNFPSLSSPRKRGSSTGDRTWIPASAGMTEKDTGTTNRQDVAVLARVRYRQPLVPATLRALSPKLLALSFDTPVQFVAEGQSAVWYSKTGKMLGGGIIHSFK